MARQLEGKVAIVTGGSRGIGAAIAENLASKGCSLLLNYTSPSSAGLVKDLSQKLSSTYSVQCHIVQADLSKPEESADKIIASAKQFFARNAASSSIGKGDISLTIDILINNAGVAGNKCLNDPEKGPINAEDFHRQYTINVLGPLLLTQAVVPYLPRDRSGRIVNLSSVSSSLGFLGQSVYGGTKAALEAMTRTWARELADYATVNAVNPGPVMGDMYWEAGEWFWNSIQAWQDNTPGSRVVAGKDGLTDIGAARLSEGELKTVTEKMGGRRPAFPDEIAGVVGMLCTRDAQWCTGSVVCANGGMRMGS